MADLASLTDLLEAAALLGFVWWLHRMVKPMSAALMREPPSVEAESKFKRLIALLDWRANR